MSFGFRSGSTPMKTDSRWVRWAKILTHYQSLAGADARNDLRQTDPLRMLKVKVLAAIQGIAACWCNDNPVPCVNLIIGDASYGIFGDHTYEVTGLLPNTTYKLIAGANESGYHNGGGALVPFTDGQIVYIVTGATPDLVLVGFLGNTPVTATVCQQ